jgi:hypothetical protein
MDARAADSSAATVATISSSRDGLVNAAMLSVLRESAREA